MKSTAMTAIAAAVLFFGATFPTGAHQEGKRDGQGDKQQRDEHGKADRPQGGRENRPPQQNAPRVEPRPQQPPEQARERQQRREQAPRQVEQPEHTQQRQRPQREQQAPAQAQRAPQTQQQPQSRREQAPRGQREPQQAQRQVQPPAQRQPQPQRTQQQARAWQQQRGWLKQGGGWQGRATWQQNRAQNWSSEHRSWQQRGGYGGSYVPPDRFNQYFGSRHFFRLQTRPVMYQGYPRFEYNGYAFLLLDPWPEYWSDSWYSSDDVYIDYDDGYYLYSRRDPRVRLAITLAL